jgi:Flp pilus assembly protein TadG
MQKAGLRSPRQSRFLACRDGTSATEFAIVLPVLLLMVSGIIEMSLLFFVDILAEGGLREAARYGITGQGAEDGVREDEIIQIVNDHTHGLIDLETANLSTKSYSSFGAIGQPEPFVDGSNGLPANGEYDVGEDFDDINENDVWDGDQGKVGAGGPGDVVMYELSYDWEFITPVLSIFAGQDNRVNMTASIAVRNEPYGSAGDGGE